MATNSNRELVAKATRDDSLGKPHVVASDQFCCSDFLSWIDWIRGNRL